MKSFLSSQYEANFDDSVSRAILFNTISMCSYSSISFSSAWIKAGKLVRSGNQRSGAPTAFCRRPSRWVGTFGPPAWRGIGVLRRILSAVVLHFFSLRSWARSTYPGKLQVWMIFGLSLGIWNQPRLCQRNLDSFLPSPWPGSRGRRETCCEKFKL